MMTPVLTKQAYARRGAGPYSVYVETLEGPGFHWEWQELCPRHPSPPAEVWYDWTPKMAQNIPKKPCQGVFGCLGMGCLRVVVSIKGEGS